MAVVCAIRYDKTDPEALMIDPLVYNASKTSSTIFVEIL